MLVKGATGCSLVSAAYQLADSRGWWGLDSFFYLNCYYHYYYYCYSTFSSHCGHIACMCVGCSGEVFVWYVTIAVVSDICIATTEDCWSTCRAGHFLRNNRTAVPVLPYLGLIYVFRVVSTLGDTVACHQQPRPPDPWFRWMPWRLINIMSTLDQLMAW